MHSSVNTSYELENVQKNWERLCFLPLPIVAFCLNFFLFITTTMNRKKLERQNYVYLCVISILLSNVLYILLHVWYTFDSFFGLIDKKESKAKVSASATLMLAILFESLLLLRMMHLFESRL